MYVRVYSPKGEAFDVTRERADKLLLEQGWTQTQAVESEHTPDPEEDTPAEKLALDELWKELFDEAPVEEAVEAEAEQAPAPKKSRRKRAADAAPEE